MSDTSKVTPEFERIAGLVERVTYHNAQNGFCVLRLKVKGEYVSLRSNIPFRKIIIFVVKEQSD